MMGVEAKLFRNGGSQAVRIPKDFRFDGDQVIIEKRDGGLFIRAKPVDELAWLEKLQALADAAGAFMPNGREQPDMPKMKPDVAAFFGCED
jgi:antitoxin VapB